MNDRILAVINCALMHVSKHSVNTRFIPQLSTMCYETYIQLFFVSYTVFLTSHDF